jgi:hypothetical protein
MKTPAGKECRYFFGDYYRGRNHEECRLLSSTSPQLAWKPELCFTCPVPGIQMANACDFMNLKPRLVRQLPLLKKEVRVDTYCSKTNRSGFDPHIGCGECHHLPSMFKDVIGGTDTAG